MKRHNRCNSWTHKNWPERWRGAWKVATNPGDVFKVGGPATNLSPRTVLNDEMAFGRYQQFLHTEGRTDSDPAPSLDNLRAFSQYLGQSIAPSSVMAILSQVVGAIRLMVPAADLRDANSAIQRFAGEVQPVRKTSEKVRSPIELIAIGNAIMAEVDANPDKDRFAPYAYRNGALITAASYCPLRLRNWRMMRIDEHVDLGTGRVKFKPHETKRKKELEFQLPPEVLEVLRRYVDVYRPLLLRPGSRDQGYLWPGPNGGIMHRNAIGIAVKGAIFKHTKQHFNFHLFRHSAATFISETTPERTQMTSGVLHHARLSTANKYYIKGQKRRAHLKFQSAVRDIAAKARRRTTRAVTPKKKGNSGR